MFYRKEEASLERFLCQAANEPSIGLTELQKNLKQNIPLDISTQKKLKPTYESLIKSIPDIENTIMEVRNLKRIEKPLHLLNSHIESSLTILLGSKYFSNNH